MNKVRNFVKTALLFFAYLVRCIRSPFSNTKEVVVLMYHSVEGSHWKYGVSPHVFERQLQYFVQHKRIVPLAHIVEYVTGRRQLESGTIVLTFDDGYADTYTHVFPLVKKYNVPVTVFLTTNLSPLAVLGNLPRPTEAQIIEMAASGLVSFQVHGHNHLNVKTISHDQTLLSQEFVTSKEVITCLSGTEPRYVAYAAGHKNNETIEFLKQNGFDAGFTITEGLVKQGSDPFLIKRVQVDRTMNFAMVILRLTAAVDINRRLVDIARRLWKRKQ